MFESMICWNKIKKYLNLKENFLNEADSSHERTWSEEEFERPYVALFELAWYFVTS